MLRLVHELSRFDRPLMIEHFCSLNSTDRYLRFGLPRDDDSLKEYVEAIDFERDLVLGVFGPGFKLVAVAHVGLIDDTAELGLSVVSEFRRQNLASLAVQRAARSRQRRKKVVDSFSARESRDPRLRTQE